MRFATVTIIMLFLAGTIMAQDAGDTAQEKPKSSFTFSGGVDLGSDVLLTGAPDLKGSRTPQTWTRLGFQPDFGFGKIGLGLDLTIHFMLYPDQDTSFKPYPGDWVPNYRGNGRSFFDVYLPKILYVA